MMRNLIIHPKIDLVDVVTPGSRCFRLQLLVTGFGFVLCGDV